MENTKNDKKEDKFVKMGASVDIRDRNFLGTFTSLFSASKRLFGLGRHFNKYAVYRYEKYSEEFFKKKKLIYIGMRVLHAFVPYSKYLKLREQICLYFLLFLQNYKTYRHLKGLPARGQRT
jgi:hypothetical protein